MIIEILEEVKLIMMKDLLNQQNIHSMSMKIIIKLNKNKKKE